MTRWWGGGHGNAQKVVMPIDYPMAVMPSWLTAASRAVKDFKGKKCGFNPLSPSDFLLSYASRPTAMTDKDIVPLA